MANAGQARFDVGLNDKDFDRGLRDLERKTDRSLDSVGQKWQKLGKDVSRVGRGFTLGITLPVVGAGAAILKTAGDFERSLNRVSALTGATGQAFERLREQARDLGATTQFSASEAADAMAFLAQAGFTADEIYGSLPDTLKLAGAAQLDLARSADIVSNILTGFQLPVSELGRAVDVLSKTFTSANTDLNQLGEAFKFVGPVATSVGQEFEETAAALGLLSNAGLQASQAGTGLRQVLIGMSKEQEIFGISTRDASGQLRPFTDFLADAERRGVSLEEAIEAFSVRGGPAFLAVLGQGSDALRDLRDDLRDAAGTADQIQAVQLQGLNARLTELRSAAEGLAIAFGDSGLLGSATDLVAKITDQVRKFAELDDGTKRLIVTTALLLAGIGPVLTVTGRLISATGFLITNFTRIVGAVRLLGGPVGIFATAAVAYVKLNDALDAGRETRERTQANFEGMVLRMQEYRNELAVTSEAERSAALEALERQRRVLEVTLQNQQAFFNAVQADVVAFANKGFFGQLFSFGAANVDLRLLDQLEDQIGTLQREIAAVNTEINRVTDLDLTPRNVGLVDISDFDFDPDAAGAGAGAAMAAAAERVFNEGSLGFLYQRLAESNDAFEEAADDAGRAAAQVLIRRYQEAIDEIESRFIDAPVAEAARIWAERLVDELELGLKSYGEVFDLLAPRAEELRQEAATALDDFGFDSQQYQDARARLLVIEDALRRINALTPGISLAVTGQASDVGRILDLTNKLQLGTAPAPELIEAFRELQVLSPNVAKGFEGLARELLEIDRAAREAVSSTASLRAEEDFLQGLQPDEVQFSDERSRFVRQLVGFLESGAGLPGQQLEAYRALQAVAPQVASRFNDLARELLQVEGAAQRVVSSTADLRLEEDSLQALGGGQFGLPAPTSDAAQRVAFLAEALEAGTIPVAEQLGAFRELQGLAPGVARAFFDLASELTRNENTARRVVAASADLRREEDELQALWSSPPPAPVSNQLLLAQAEEVLAGARERLLQITGQSPTPLEQFRTQMELLITQTPLAAEGLRSIVDEVDELISAADQLAADRAEAQGFFTSPSQLRARELGVSDEQFNELVEMGSALVEGFEPILLGAAADFSETIASAGVRFASDIAQAFLDGDPSKAVGGLASFGATIAQTLLPGIKGVLLGGAIQILGQIFSGLFGGRQQEQEARRADGARVRGAPALQLNLTVQQSLNVQTLTDPQSRAAINGLLDDTVERLVQVVDTVVMPRIERLENRV